MPNDIDNISAPESQTPPTSEPSAEEAALAAMDEGIAEATPEPVDPVEVEAATPVPAAADAPDAPEDLAKDSTKTDSDAASAKPEPNAETEAEIVKLGLKEASAERFRGMANEIRGFAPMRDALKQAGIDDVARIPELIQHDKDYRDLIGMVQQTGATPEQYGAALDYLRAVNQATTGDRASAERAYDVMAKELQALAQMLGKPVPGVYDPLQEFPDLRQAIADGDMTEKAAVEMASLRKGQAMDAAGRQVIAQRQQEEHAQTAMIQQGTDDLNRLGMELAAADPHYARKAPVLVDKLREMQQRVPPQQWAAVARTLYSMIPNAAVDAPAAAPAPTVAKPTPGPLRGIPLRPNVMPVTDDPMEALEQGIAAASR